MGIWFLEDYLPFWKIRDERGLTNRQCKELVLSLHNRRLFVKGGTEFNWGRAVEEWPRWRYYLGSSCDQLPKDKYLAAKVMERLSIPGPHHPDYEVLPDPLRLRAIALLEALLSEGALFRGWSTPQAVLREAIREIYGEDSQEVLNAFPRNSELESFWDFYIKFFWPLYVDSLLLHPYFVEEYCQGHGYTPALPPLQPSTEPPSTEGKQAAQSMPQEQETTIATINVFISYAWKDHERKKIGELAQWLNKQEGIKVTSDHIFEHNTFPKDGWPKWMEKKIKEVDIVLCICGENYKKAFEGEGGGKGSTWEGAIITNELYEKFRQNDKYSVILPKANAYELVPGALTEWMSGLLLTNAEGQTNHEGIRAHIKAQYKLQQAGKTQISQDNSQAPETDTEKKHMGQQPSAEPANGHTTVGAKPKKSVGGIIWKVCAALAFLLGFAILFAPSYFPTVDQRDDPIFTPIAWFLSFLAAIIAAVVSEKTSFFSTCWLSFCPRSLIDCALCFQVATKVMDARLASHRHVAE